MKLIGIDENGYGPVLGPLVVTSVSLQITQKGNRETAPDLWRLLEIKNQPLPFSDAPVVCDSKTLFHTSRKREVTAENTILAFFYLCFGFVPESADSFLKPVLNHSHSVLQEKRAETPVVKYDRNCFCWKNDFNLGLNPERRELILKSAEKLRKQADKTSIRLDKPCCFLLCPSLFNRGLKNKNKSDLVVEGGLRLVRRHALDGRFLACLGKVGTSRYYQGYISAFFGPEFSVTPAGEETHTSAYNLSRNGEAAGTISYLQNGEGRSFLISLASLFGKYTRELFWKKTRVFFDKNHQASGYRDSLTKRFIKKTEKMRFELGIPDDCFLRRK